MRFLLPFIIILSGCALDAGSVEVTGSGLSEGVQTRTITCESGTTLQRYEAGSGAVAITLTDGAGQKVFNDAVGGAGEINDQQQVTGHPGTWTMSVDPGGFAGQFKITLECP